MAKLYFNLRCPYFHETINPMRSPFVILIFIIIAVLLFLLDSIFLSNQAQLKLQVDSLIEPKQSSGDQKTKESPVQPLQFFSLSDFELEMINDLQVNDLEDVLLLVADPIDLAHLQKSESKSGFYLTDIVPQLGAVRLRITDPLKFSKILSEIKNDFDLQKNVNFNIPSLPEPRMLETEKPFIGTSMEWLGVSSDRKDRGRGVKVAILDTGIDPSHPALEGLSLSQMSLVPGEILGARGHGTGIASIIAGQSPDFLGLAPSSEILSIRVLDENGRGDAFTIAKGILTAVNEGAQLINLSLGGMESSPVIDSAIQFAKSKGAILVSATGNSGLPEVSYPARHKDVIGVSSVDAQSRVSSFSNYGKGVDIAAPGVGVVTAWENNEFTHFSGTSIAAAFVTGALASEISASPSNDSALALESLYANADETEKPGVDKWAGRGVLNVRRLEQKNTPGIVDVAVVGYYFDSENLSSSGTKPFQVTVQNQGTTWIQNMNLKVNYKGLERNFIIGNLSKGEIRSETLYFDSGNSEKKLSISSEAILSGQVDINPHNNLRKSVLAIP